MKALDFTLILSAVFSAISGHQIKGKYSGHQVWRMLPENEDALKYLSQLSLNNLELDFWKDPVTLGKTVDVRVPPNQFQSLSGLLKSQGIDFSVSIEDVQSLIDNQSHKRAKASPARTLDDFDYSIYHTVEEVYQWIDWVEEKYEFINKYQVGVTYEGRPMYVLEIKKPGIGSREEKPIIYFDALIHCREWITTASALWIFNQMLTNPDYFNMLDQVDWYFVPMINIDGYHETWTNDRLWRKTRSTGASSVCVGTDANRNWDDHWSGEGASGNPCSLTFYGPVAASESETRHLQNYILGKGNINAVVSVHSYSQLILYPYNFDYILPPDNDVLNKTAEGMHNAMFDVHNKYYTYGPGASTIYICSGVTTDWTYSKAGISLSYTFELRDEGQYGFILPENQIIPTAEEFIEGMNVLVKDVVSQNN